MSIPNSNMQQNRSDDITSEQFKDLTRYIHQHGIFRGPGGIQGDEFLTLNVIYDPSGHPESSMIYLESGMPYAVYDYDTGFTVLGH